MLARVEDMQEYIDKKNLENSFFKLSTQGQAEFVRNLISQTCWHGPVNREWLEDEIKSQEATELPKLKLVADHPIEDHFGSEIQSDDKYFTDQAGRVILESNWEDYLIEVGGVEFFKALK